MTLYVPFISMKAGPPTDHLFIMGLSKSLKILNG